MKAVYKNAFCMDHTCMNYFEDTCMVALNEKGTDIIPYTFEERDSNECGEYIAGKFIAYVMDEEEHHGNDSNQ